jgi:hypothetical protein
MFIIPEFPNKQLQGFIIDTMNVGVYLNSPAVLNPGKDP